MYAGNKSEGDIDVTINANIIRAISQRERCHGTQQYQIHMPTNGVIYPLDSEPVEKSTTNIITAARICMRNVGLFH